MAANLKYLMWRQNIYLIASKKAIAYQHKCMKFNRCSEPRTYASPSNYPERVKRKEKHKRVKVKSSTVLITELIPLNDAGVATK